MDVKYVGVILAAGKVLLATNVATPVEAVRAFTKAARDLLQGPLTATPRVGGLAEVVLASTPVPSLVTLAQVVAAELAELRPAVPGTSAVSGVQRTALDRVRSAVRSFSIAARQSPITRFPQLQACPYVERFLESVLPSNLSQSATLAVLDFLLSVVPPESL